MWVWLSGCPPPWGLSASLPPVSRHASVGVVCVRRLLLPIAAAAAAAALAAAALAAAALAQLGVLMARPHVACRF